jgi:hypothetical protein
MPSDTATPTVRLPVEADVDPIERALYEVFNMLENVVGDLKGLEVDFGGENSLELPEVTTENIAALVRIRSDIRARMDDYQRFETMLDRRIDDACLLRGEQQFQLRRREEKRRPDDAR